jgi:hypothetical protein
MKVTVYVTASASTISDSSVTAGGSTAAAATGEASSVAQTLTKPVREYPRVIARMRNATRSLWKTTVLVFLECVCISISFLNPRPLCGVEVSAFFSGFLEN